MKLDALTLFASMFINLTLIVGALLLGVGWKTRSGMRLWNMALVLQAIAWACLVAAYRGWPRELATLGSAAMVAGFSFMYMAAKTYLREPISLAWVIGVPVVTAVLHWLMFHDFVARILIVNAAIGLQMLWLAWLLLRPGSQGSWRWRWLAGLALLASGAMVACRAVLVVVAPESYPRFESPHWVNIVGLIVSNACVMAGTLAFLLAYRDEAEQELKRLATTDGLTGVLNRRHWMESAVTHFNLARRHGRGLVVLMLDIDFFKRINDSRGHQAGDRALVLFAEALRHVVRQPDLVGRYGGEEFCVLLPMSDVAAAQAVDQRLRAALVRDMNPKLGFDVTFSAGVASLDDDHTTLDELIARADQALYAAKQAGRNRLVAADLPDIKER
ncbi:GGDEF domain-containing protein [Piscinibacter sp. HJYY11]|uniref:GGDEF domain-containing protein n=1 Tax=Piscinibacter sp. HJYY11 TaxID=2801333 RepID=UPI00191ECE2F|nr:GGDEF domain-containing protein [Piscinibacter sp. HJYY11]MBL0727717.1 GGDEF domain-containing protein [Piscinibacter sp. HJYY11]